ncbi:hypothetical protein M0R45_027895 [Rubus argutus]|uniref:Uncharacterized protein n=1 Tax=Rubus argutus TaxID=59490 RepID=A0AAW1W650_RUBAR
MSGSRVLLTYKRKRQSRSGLLQENGGHNSPSVAPEDTALSRPTCKFILLIRMHQKIMKQTLRNAVYVLCALLVVT